MARTFIQQRVIQKSIDDMLTYDPITKKSPFIIDKRTSVLDDFQKRSIYQFCNLTTDEILDWTDRIFDVSQHAIGVYKNVLNLKYDSEKTKFEHLFPYAKFERIRYGVYLGSARSLTSTESGPTKLSIDFLKSELSKIYDARMVEENLSTLMTLESETFIEKVKRDFEDRFEILAKYDSDEKRLIRLWEMMNDYTNVDNFMQLSIKYHDSDIKETLQNLLYMTDRFTKNQGQENNAYRIRERKTDILCDMTVDGCDMNKVMRSIDDIQKALFFDNVTDVYRVRKRNNLATLAMQLLNETKGLAFRMSPEFENDSQLAIRASSNKISKTSTNETFLKMSNLQWDVSPTDMFSESTKILKLN